MPSACQNEGAEPLGSTLSALVSGTLTHSSTHGVTSSIWGMVMKSSMTAGKTMLGQVHVAVHILVLPQRG